MSGSAIYQRVQAAEQVPLACAGQRVDQVCARLWPDFSRSQLQTWIKSGALRVDQRRTKASHKLSGGEWVQLDAQWEQHDEHRAEAIPLDLLYQDDALLVVNKPCGMVTHPAAGNWSGTLQNALLHFDPQLALLPRAGIIHRLDKDTSGALLVARTPAVRQQLVEAMQQRLIERRYCALVWGRPPLEQTIDAPIARHPRERTRMAVVAGGKPARTHLSCAARWQHASRLVAKLESGRTHQIRVHCAHAGYPLVGDPVYGRRHPPGALAPELQALLVDFQQQALHAQFLAFDHPLSEQRIALEAPLPAAIVALMAAFDAHDAV